MGSLYWNLTRFLFLSHSPSTNSNPTTTPPSPQAPVASLQLPFISATGCCLKSTVVQYFPWPRARVYHKCNVSTNVSYAPRSGQIYLILRISDGFCCWVEVNRDPAAASNRTADRGHTHKRIFPKCLISFITCLGLCKYLTLLCGDFSIRERHCAMETPVSVSVQVFSSWVACDLQIGPEGYF